VFPNVRLTAVRRPLRPVQAATGGLRGPVRLVPGRYIVMRPKNVGVITYGELILTVNGQETGTVPRTPNTRRDSRKLPRRSSSASTGR